MYTDEVVVYIGSKALSPITRSAAQKGFGSFTIIAGRIFFVALASDSLMSPKDSSLLQNQRS